MARLLYRVGTWCFRRGWLVLAGWLVVLGIIAGIALSVQRPFSPDFRIEGTPSIDATHDLVKAFPDDLNPVAAASVNLVFAAPEGEKLADYSAAIDGVVHRIEEGIPDLTGTERFGNPLEISPKLVEMVEKISVEQGLPEEVAQADAQNLKMVSEDGRIGYTTFTFDVPTSMDVTPEQRRIVNEAMQEGRDQGLIVEAGGPGFGDPIQVKSTSELVGLGVAFIVLILTFGSLVAAGLPLITAVIGVGMGSLLIIMFTHWWEFNNITPVLAVMIGLAVGIDYALFILSRYRSERVRMDARTAAGMAVATAGSAVVFAGVTVIVALVALVTVRIEFLSAMGLTAAMTVFIAVLVALTLIPALLGIFKDKAFAGRVPFIAGNRKAKSQRPSFGRRWVTFVHRFPALIVGVVILGLGALSAPVLDLDMALPSDATQNYNTTQRKSSDLMEEAFGAGVNAPFLMLVDAHEAHAEAPALQPFIEAQTEGSDQEKAALAAFLYSTQTANSLGQVKHAQLVNVNADKTVAQVLVTPYTGPADNQTLALAHSLRARAQEIEAATGAHVGLTGLTAVQMDITERLAEAMPIYLGIVVGLAIILLLIVFRSLLVPLIAGLGFLLSVGAAFGLTVLVWQQGLWGLVNTPAPLVSFLPVFFIGVTFGLAMDYQVFLVTRMREYITSYDPAEQAQSRYNAVESSVIEGFSSAARVVNAAALIMIAVFVAFIDQPLPFIQIFGFALGAGVLFDAFFVRMALVPASMFLMGRATWWMPQWLDRILPQLDIEGTALEKEWEALHSPS